MNAMIIFAFAFLGVGCSAEIHARDGTDIPTLWDPLISTVSFYRGQILTPTCTQAGCPLSKISPSLCPALCSPSISKFQSIFNSVAGCYRQPLCGFNLTSQTLNNVYQPFNVSGYSGSCVLSGSQVTVSLPLPPLSPVSSVVTSANQSSTVVGYQVNTLDNFNWQGLIINCSSNENANSARAINIIQLIGCFLFGKFVPITTFLNLNCNSNSASNSFSGNIAFQSSVAFTTFYTIDKTLTGSDALVNNQFNVTISGMTGAVPASWVPQISSALQTLFNNNGFGMLYFASIYNTPKQLFYNIILPACNATTCNA